MCRRSFDKMRPCALLFVVFLLHVSESQLNGTNITTNLTVITTPSPITTTAVYFTTEAGCSANYAFVFIRSSLSTLKETAPSERVNYPPYAYPTTVINKKIVLFENGENMTDSMNNPCNISTWSEPPSYYDDTIVLITYNNYFDNMCNTQQWTLNLENYGNIKGVIIDGNNDVYLSTLSGDTKIIDPTIPTRMISQMTANKIRNTLKNTTEDVFGSIDCFNDTSYPPRICIRDDSSVNLTVTNVYIDGEFQEQANLMVNDHPVWYKEGHYGVFLQYRHNDYYIWLTVNHSLDNSANPWRWVIGTNYTDDNSINLECILNTTDYIDDPSGCGNNWYRNGVFVNISSHGGICNRGDTFICMESSTGDLAGASFLGRFRQYHKNEYYWVHETVPDTFILLDIEGNWFGLNETDYVLGEMYNGYALVWALCPFLVPVLTNEIALSVWDCPGWYYLETPFPYGISVTLSDLDVDECAHPNITTNVTTVYPEMLCLRDTTNNASSFYQSYGGIYVLDNTTQYNDRSVYKSQRLNGLWSFIYVDLFDRWLIDDEIPSSPIPNSVFGYCDENVVTPDLCTACWIFTSSVQNPVEVNCNISLIAINSSVESDCIGDIPVNNIINYTDEIVACFDDGVTDMYSSSYTGKYTLMANRTFNGRAVWFTNNSVTGDTWYLYYSERWKYWVIYNVIEEQSIPSWDLICLSWKQFEPWNCTEWYAFNVTVSKIIMTPNCPSRDPTIDPTFDPTFEPSVSPTDDTKAPTNNPTIEFTQTLNSDDENDGNGKNSGDGKNFDTIIIVVVVLILGLCIIGIIAFICYKKKSKNEGYTQDVDNEEMIKAIEMNQTTENNKEELVSDSMDVLDNDKNDNNDDTLMDSGKTL